MRFFIDTAKVEDIRKANDKEKQGGIPCFFTDMERYFGCKPRSYLVY